MRSSDSSGNNLLRTSRHPIRAHLEQYNTAASRPMLQKKQLKTDIVGLWAHELILAYHIYFSNNKVIQMIRPDMNAVFRQIMGKICPRLSARFAVIIPLLRHFTILGQKNAQNMPRYYTEEQGKNTD